MISKKLYNNLPYYLRLLDEQGSGLLKHLTDPVQTQFDRWEDSKGLLELINNPDTIPKDWAYWAQQKVGGSGTREYWLGVGLHPDWPVERMRRFLKEGWNYWNTKGTQSAIRWAIDFWLDWEKAQSPIYLEFRRPFGDRPSNHPTQWWSWGTPYDAFTTQNYTERQFFGGGDYPQQYQPDYTVLKQDTWQWEYDAVYDDCQLVLDKPIEIDNSRSGLGPRNVWMHFHLDETEWNNVAPDIHKLNPETWHSLARPQVFLWQDITTTLKLVEDPEFPISTTTVLYDIDGFKYNDIYPWPVEQAPRTEVYLVDFAWQPSPHFEFSDSWGGAGGKIVPHEDRYTRTEVLQFASNWTAYSFLTTVSKTVTVPGVPAEQVLLPVTVAISTDSGSSSAGLSLEIASDRTMVVGADYLTVYGFEANTNPLVETKTELTFSPAVELFTDYQDVFGSAGGLPITRLPELLTITILAETGGDYLDLFYSQGSTTTAIYTTTTQAYVGADYLATYNEMWQYNVDISSIEESTISFLNPAELWSLPYSQVTVLQEYPITYSQALPGNQWWAGDRYTEIEFTTITPATTEGGVSELWQITNFYLPDDEEVEVFETVEAIGFNGVQYSDIYAWEVPATTAEVLATDIAYLWGTDYQSRYDAIETWTCAIESTIATIIETPVSSGAGIPWTIQLGAWMEIVEELIPGIPEFTDPSTTHLWYAPYREWQEEIEIEIPGTQSCWSGLLADVEVEEQEIIVPAAPGFPPALWGEMIPDSEMVIAVPGSSSSVGVDYLTPFLGSRLPQSIAHENLAPISLEGIAPLVIDVAPQPAITFNPNIAFDLFEEENGTFDSEDWWQCVGKPATETIVTIEGGFRLSSPQLCFQYFDTYGQNFEWYTAGEVCLPTTKTEPISRQYHLCNVVDNYTLQKIENRREVIETIPVSERAIEKVYPLLQVVAKQQEWTLSVETDEDLILVQPLVLFTEKDGERSLDISLDHQLDLEFVFIVGRSTHIRSITLFVGQEMVENKTYAIPLNVHPKDKIGFKFILDLEPVPTGVIG